MKLRMIGLSLALGLLLVGCGAEKTITEQKVAEQEFTEQVIQQSEEMAASAAEQTEAQEMIPDDASQSGQEVQSEQGTQMGAAEEQETGVASKTPEGGETSGDAAMPDDTASVVDDLEHQLAVIYANRADWYTADLEMGSYTVTDLDQNGKLEVLAAVCMGSGMYTYTDVWEVDGDALVKCEWQLDEFDSQVDLIVSETVAYAVDGGWTYIFYDTVRMGAMGYNCDLRGVILRDGAISEQTYATLSETVDGESSVLEAATAEGETLTEDQFYALKDNLLPGEKRQVTFRWINVMDGEFDLNAASEADAIAMLGDLYAAFGLA